MSVGVACFAPGEVVDVDDLLRRADVALYEQKRVRARLSLATPLSAPLS